MIGSLVSSTLRALPSSSPHATESLDRVGDDAFPVLGNRQVGDDRERAGQRGGERLEPVPAASGEDDGSARSVEDTSEPITQS